MTIKSKKHRRRAKATAKGEKQPQRQNDDDERLHGREWLFHWNSRGLKLIAV
jgi:hypothetical protein